MKLEYQFKTLYDPGTAKVLEDKFVAAPPFFGVFDGMSGLYHPSAGPQMFGGVAGGQKFVELAADVVKRADSGEPLADVASRINDELRRFVEENGLDASHPEDSPGMEFTLAKVSDEGIEIIQGGDAFAVWVKQDGSSGATPNQNYLYEKELLDLLQPLTIKYPADKDAVWKEYLPLLGELRRERANRGRSGDYVVLNGDPASAQFWNRKKFAPGELKQLFLFTDGLVDFPDTRDEHALARLVAETYARGGLAALFARIREIEKKELGERHIDQAEATGIAITFDT